MSKFVELDSIEPKKKSWIYFFVKRGFDLFNSLLAILLLSWLMIIVAIIIFCTNPGHVIFLDKRMGKNGKTIGVLKFRSMYADAETHPEKYLTPEQIEQWKVERKVLNDGRITPFGKIIRKTSIDELPQLINIFIGNMSFVGPRPITIWEVDKHFTDKQKETLSKAKPGLTGLWQVSGRSEVTWESGGRQKLELDYLTKRSLWMDLKILLKTVPAVFKKKGAR